jgi:hypothetical protein
MLNWLKKWWDGRPEQRPADPAKQADQACPGAKAEAAELSEIDKRAMALQAKLEWQRAAPWN